MGSFNEVTAALRRRGRKNYLLLIGCCFFSVLLITAYTAMMRSPTVLSVLPEGGDSRKQVMMVFVLTVVGCAVFTTYAAGLFFRSKSRETGIFMALGASRAQMRGQLYRELALLSLSSCGAGALLGVPLAWAVWQVFRTLVVDTAEMSLAFDPRAYLFSLIFSAFVIASMFLMAARSIRRTNIIDIVNEARKSEPIRDVKPWYGKVGVLLLAAGGFLGYMAPSFFILQLHWYPPEGFTAIFYAPAFVGLYMVLLHTVVNGWGGGKKRYRHIISTSMMKFQGRQTVRNMLVITVLLAGAYFAMFYAPMLTAGGSHGYSQRPIDYQYHFRSDQDIPRQEEVRQLAADHGVTITSWAEGEGAILGVDGYAMIETSQGALGTTWAKEYRQLLAGCTFLPESVYNALTGQTVDVPAGTVVGVMDDEGNSNGMFGGNATHLTNMVTGAEMEMTPSGQYLSYSMLFGRFVMDDGDYAAITAGLTDDWRETFQCFNVENVEASYDFAKALFYKIVRRSGPEVAQLDGWDPVEQVLAHRAGESYWAARENLVASGFQPIDYSQPDSSAFRLYWLYAPQFRVLEQNDFLKTMAVFIMLFIFIALVCFAAVVVIAYTRCLTIALNNVQMYDDLRRLGASPWYLYCAVRRQVSRVFFVPALVGTAAIWGLYLLIMWFNGDPAGFSGSEISGMVNCLWLTALGSGLLYGVYRITLKNVLAHLNIRRA